jgi:hypothetical protein
MNGEKTNGCEERFVEIGAEVCKKIRAELLEQGVVMLVQGDLVEMIVKEMKKICGGVSEERLWRKVGYWFEAPFGIGDRCGIRAVFYDEFGERFGFYPYVFTVRDPYEAYELLLKKGEIRRL